MFIKLIYIYKLLVNATQFRLLLLYQFTRLMELAFGGDFSVRVDSEKLNNRREKGTIQNSNTHILHFPTFKGLSLDELLAALHLHATSATNFQIE